MKTTNSISKGRAALMNQVRAALAGAIARGEDAQLAHNTAPRIAAEVYDLLGNPATPAIRGKQPLYSEQLARVKVANAAKDAAIAAGREFCRLAINLLRPVLGNQWNRAWQAAGFHLPSLALPRQPVAMLSGLRNYFATNPERENALANVTAVQAETRAQAIDDAILAAASAKQQRLELKRQRDAALRAVRKRLIGLRAELALLLEPEDGRWYEFGFRRPADGRQPEPVAEVTLTAAAAGTVLATWPSSPRATSFRVTWKPAADAGTDTAAESRIVHHTQCTLTGLPPGETIIISVAARNTAGETAPAEATVVVPG